MSRVPSRCMVAGVPSGAGVPALFCLQLADAKGRSCAIFWGHVAVEPKLLNRPLDARLPNRPEILATAQDRTQARLVHTHRPCELLLADAPCDQPLPQYFRGHGLHAPCSFLPVPTPSR